MRLSFCDCLGLLFVGLKLTGHIQWSWWWVLSPSIFELVLIILVVLGKACEEKPKTGREELEKLRKLFRP